MASLLKFKIKKGKGKLRLQYFSYPLKHLIYINDLFQLIMYAAAAKSLQSCPTLWDPIDGSPPGSPVSGILQARTLEWVPFPSPMQESEK